MFDPADHPHRRRNLLTGDWVLVSPHRARRPWQGEQAINENASLPSYDPACYLCPGNERQGGHRNPDYHGPYVFQNDFPALLADTPAPPESSGLFEAAPACGEARVVCFSPDHARTLPELGHGEVRKVVDSWCAQSEELGRRWTYVEVFENKGAMMGCSSPHPHSQIWAGDFVPTLVAQEDRQQREWLATRGTPLLDEVAAAEEVGPRLVEKSAHCLCIVPWWAAWPFETLLIARDPVSRLEDLGGAAREDLALMLRRLTARYDNLFGTSFPYSAGWHGAPHGQAESAHWRLHAHFYPPLLRSATIRKFMVGYELLAEAQRDLTPEQAAERLRGVSAELGA